MTNTSGPKLLIAEERGYAPTGFTSARKALFNYKETLEVMRRERASKQAEVDKLDQAIAALQALAGDGPLSRTNPKPRSAQAKKARKTKRKISAEGLRNIIAAQNKRWARVRAAAKKKGQGARKI